MTNNPLYESTKEMIENIQGIRELSNIENFIEELRKDNLVTT